MLHWILPRHKWMKRVQDVFTDPGDKATSRGLDEQNHCFGWMTRHGHYIRTYFRADGVLMRAEFYPGPELDTPQDVTHRGQGMDFGRPPW